MNAYMFSGRCLAKDVGILQVRKFFVSVGVMSPVSAGFRRKLELMGHMRANGLGE
jgi:hypothetical protein